MDIALLVLTGLGCALAGFQIGSVVEYYKKYNLYDLEHDKVTALLGTLLDKIHHLL